MTMDYSPCPEREIWPFLKGSNISEMEGVTPTKTGVNACDTNSNMHEFYEPIMLLSHNPMILLTTFVYFQFLGALWKAINSIVPLKKEVEGLRELSKNIKLIESGVDPA